MYYLRSQAAVGAVKFNLDVSVMKEAEIKEEVEEVEEECLMCSA